MGKMRPGLGFGRARVPTVRCPWVPYLTLRRTKSPPRPSGRRQRCNDILPSGGGAAIIESSCCVDASRWHHGSRLRQRRDLGIAAGLGVDGRPGALN